MPTAAHSRFDALDGLRGIVALVVMLGHYTEHNGLHWLEGAWISVDLFYVLSGFVIMHGYGRRIAAGMSLGQFVDARLRRLAPLYLIGLLLGTVAALRYVAMSADAPIGVGDVGRAALLNLLLLPDFNARLWPFGSDTIPGAVFPLNDPTWSLCFELIANLVFFAYVRHQRGRHAAPARLALVAGTAGLGFVLVIGGLHEFNPGWGTHNFFLAFPRALFGFFLGALIYTLYQRLPRPSPLFVALIFGATAFCFCSPLFKVTLVATFALSPYLIALLCRMDLDGRWRRVCSAAGAISYPLYATHFPVYRLLYEFTDIGRYPVLVQTGVIATVALGVALALIPIDQSIRRRLSRKPRAGLQGALAP